MCRNECRIVDYELNSYYNITCHKNIDSVKCSADCTPECNCNKIRLLFYNSNEISGISA